MDYDVVVVGAGNAAMCAALAAEENGAKVLVLEAAPEDLGGGNTRFTAGAIRTVYNGVDDLRELMPDLTDAECEITDFGTYTEDQFFDDMFRVTEFRTDPELVEILVKNSFDTLKWMRGKGVRFAPIWGRQAFKVDGRFKFWGGLTVEAYGGGPGLCEALWTAARERGIDLLFEARAIELLSDGIKVTGVKIRHKDAVRDIRAKAVVLAAGGFQANSEWRTRYLGPGWDLAKVRGTPYNVGDGIRMATAIGASTSGNWSGCHAVGWERNAPEFGDLAVGDAFQKHSYPFGIMVNATGRRFVDEGADFRNYTYAKYGRVILNQPQQFAWQIFDQKVTHLLRDEYRIRQVTKVTADTIEALAEQLDGVDAKAFVDEIKRWNDAVMKDVPFNPNVKDGRGTNGLAIPKSNWANTLDKPPYEAYQITCGITFTFGGVRIDGNAQVQSTDYKPIAGLYAAGEMVGGIFYFNYPGGSGLINGAVFGKIAGTSAGKAVKKIFETQNLDTTNDGNNNTARSEHCARRKKSIYETYPRLYHLAWENSIDGIIKHGLLSTKALLNLYKSDKAEIDKLITTLRPEPVHLSTPGLPPATLRDQKPMKNGLEQALQDDVSRSEWLTLLNSMVFLWPTKDRLKSMKNAYKNVGQILLVLDCKKLLENECKNIRLSHINSGYTGRSPAKRNLSLFKTISDYPLEEKKGSIAEICVVDRIQNISRYIIKIKKIDPQQR